MSRRFASPQMGPGSFDHKVLFFAWVIELALRRAPPGVYQTSCVRVRPLFEGGNILNLAGQDRHVFLTLFFHVHPFR